MSIVTKEGASLGTRSNGAESGVLLHELAERHLWHSSAPAAVRSAWREDPDGAAWRAWAGHLRRRKRLKLAGEDPMRALDWAVDPPREPGDLGHWLRDLRKRLDQKTPNERLAEAAEGWVESSLLESANGGQAEAMRAVAWAYAAPIVASRIESGLWWRLIEQLHAVAIDARALRPGDEASAEELLQHQLLGGELSLVLGSLFSEMRPMRGLRKEATSALTEGLLATTDGEGLPPARCLPAMTGLVACWTRCRALAERQEKRCWDSQAETQFEWLVRQAIRLARPDGTTALTSGPAASPALFEAALSLGGDESDFEAASLRLRPKPVKSEGEEPPTPSVNSEWSGLAVLATDWKPKAPRLTVAYEGPEMALELAADTQLLFSGVWPVEVEMEGAPIGVEGDWEEQCWFSDDESDYLELSIDLENGAKLERQIFMARDLGVAYLSEIVLSKTQKPISIEVKTRLPFGSGVAFSGEEATREGWLSNGTKNLAGVLPLALPEWRVDPRGGELKAEDGSLTLVQQCIGRNLCCPVALDFKPRRFAKQRTWRQLVVAERLQPVAADVAVGYRLQSGSDQMIVYRSLEQPANRTLIGQNYSSEALIGRFLSTGEVDEYFEVESES